MTFNPFTIRPVLPQLGKLSFPKLRPGEGIVVARRFLYDGNHRMTANGWKPVFRYLHEAS